MKTCKVGDVVRYSGAFLRSCGMTTAPIDGVVVRVIPFGAERTLAYVQWCDLDNGQEIGCLPANLEECRYSEAQKRTARIAVGLTPEGDRRVSA